MNGTADPICVVRVRIKRRSLMPASQFDAGVAFRCLATADMTQMTLWVERW